MNNIPAVPSFSSNVIQAQKIYGGLDDKFIKANGGKYISIELISSEYFIGKTREEAVEKANKKYKGKIVFTRRIGNLEKVAVHSSLQFPSPNNYACLF